jgi:hypothetical protein
MLVGRKLTSAVVGLAIGSGAVSTGVRGVGIAGYALLACILGGMVVATGAVLILSIRFRALPVFGPGLALDWKVLPTSGDLPSRPSPPADAGQPDDGQRSCVQETL